MISQRCPKCGSNRVRHGYTPTPIWSKFLLRYNLLCDACNWEFKGFAVPGTISTKPTRNPKKNAGKNGTGARSQNAANESASGNAPEIKRKRVRL